MNFFLLPSSISAIVSTIMKETSCSGAIFDIDGTLIDSRDGHIQSWMKAFEKFGMVVAPNDLNIHFGQKALEIARSFAPNWSDQQINDLVEFKREYFRENIFAGLKTFPKIFELFEFLANEEYKLALLTSASTIELENYKQMLKFDEYFTTAISGDDVVRSKPDPEGIIKIQRQFQIPFTEIIVFGDSSHDMLAASRVGARTIGLTTGGYSFQQLLETGAIKIFCDIEDIVAKLPISLWFF